VRLDFASMICRKVFIEVAEKCYSKPAIQSRKVLQILIIDRQSTNVFIELDGVFLSHARSGPVAREAALLEFRREYPPAYHQDAAFQPRFWRAQVSRATPANFLSSRMTTKVLCLRCPASVHSTKTTWQTSFGLTQRRCSIFSAVNDSPQREALCLREILERAPHSLQCLKGWKGLILNSRCETVLYLGDSRARKAPPQRRRSVC
jgi:hypothetical protein